MSVPGPGSELWQPIRAVNVYEETIARLLQHIRLGLVDPGSTLPPERELAGFLGVSRDTVREALGELTRAGFVVARRGRYGGTFVADPLPAGRPTPPDQEELADVLALRSVLEPGAARLAADRGPTTDEAAQLAQDLAAVADAGPADYRRLDSRLHLTLARLSGVTSLVELVAANRMRVNTLLDAIPVLQRNLKHSDEQHREIVDAVIAGDPDAAETAMRHHLVGTEALLHAFLD